MLGKLVAATAIVSACVALPARSAEIFATATDSLLRGTFGGDFPPPDFYGGSLPASFPIVLNEAAARASVLGPPDGQFLSLPGGPGVPGTAFKGAYIEVGFGANFGPNTLLTIYEVGDHAERAQLFLWTDVGGNVQPTITTNAAGAITLDLSVYGPLLTGMGASSFTKVGIGGRDELGPSKGFDLDAVSIRPVPEPRALALLALGIAGIPIFRRLRLAMIVIR